jgi:hypothetical protein
MSDRDPNECCPKFDPTPWDNVTHEWKDKLFIKDTMPVFFHIPLPFLISKLMTKMWKMVEDAGAAPEMNNFICMATDPSPWKTEYYMAVTKEVPNAENVKLSGTFISKVFDGPYNSVPKYMKEMDAMLETQGKKAKRYFFHYTACPKCAKKWGHNYIVAFAEV